MSNRRTNAWNAETQHVLTSSPKTHTFDGWETFSEEYLRVLYPLLQHRAAAGYRNMRFLRYVHKQRTVQKICDLVAPPGRPTIVGFGDWSGTKDSPISRRCCGPIEEIKHCLAKRGDVMFLSVREKKTSVTCSCCNARLTNMKETVTQVRGDGTSVDRRNKVHVVLHCRSNAAGSVPCGKTWNRDVNAARNIRRLTLCMVKGLPRPAVFG